MATDSEADSAINEVLDVARALAPDDEPGGTLIAIGIAALLAAGHPKSAIADLFEQLLKAAEAP